MDRRFTATVTDSQLQGWRRRGFSVAYISRCTGIPISKISRRLRLAYSRQPNDPSPEEVARICDEIQREWSARERAKRYVGHNARWRPVVVPASLLGLVHD